MDLAVKKETDQTTKGLGPLGLAKNLGEEDHLYADDDDSDAMWGGRARHPGRLRKRKLPVGTESDAPLGVGGRLEPEAKRQRVAALPDAPRPPSRERPGPDGEDAATEGAGKGNKSNRRGRKAGVDLSKVPLFDMFSDDVIAQSRQFQMEAKAIAYFSPDGHPSVHGHRQQARDLLEIEDKEVCSCSCSRCCTRPRRERLGKTLTRSECVLGVSIPPSLQHRKKEIVEQEKIYIMPDGRRFKLKLVKLTQKRKQAQVWLAILVPTVAVEKEVEDNADNHDENTPTCAKPKSGSCYPATSSVGNGAVCATPSSRAVGNEPNRARPGAPDALCRFTGAPGGIFSDEGDRVRTNTKMPAPRTASAKRDTTTSAATVPGRGEEGRVCDLGDVVQAGVAVEGQDDHDQDAGYSSDEGSWSEEGMRSDDADDEEDEEYHINPAPAAIANRSRSAKESKNGRPKKKLSAPRSHRFPNNCMVRIHPSQIKFCQDTCGNRFADGRGLEELALWLLDKDGSNFKDVGDAVPPIEVYQSSRGSSFQSHDNRRLLCYKVAAFYWELKNRERERSASSHGCRSSTRCSDMIVDCGIPVKIVRKRIPGSKRTGKKKVWDNEITVKKSYRKGKAEVGNGFWYKKLRDRLKEEIEIDQLGEYIEALHFADRPVKFDWSRFRHPYPPEEMAEPRELQSWHESGPGRTKAGPPSSGNLRGYGSELLPDRDAEHPGASASEFASESSEEPSGGNKSSIEQQKRFDANTG